MPQKHVFVGSIYSYSDVTKLLNKLNQKTSQWDKTFTFTLMTRNIPSNVGFSGIAGCTPSIASQWQKTAVSSGAFGNGASITYTWTIISCKRAAINQVQGAKKLFSISLHL